MDKIESVKLDMSRRSKSRTLDDREFGRCPVNQLSYSREACALCHGMYLIYIQILPKTHPYKWIGSKAKTDHKHLSH